MPAKEPRNYFYPLLLAVSVLFVVTALAWALVPTLEDKARAAGQAVEPSALRAHGGQWLLYEVAAMFIFGLLSMGLDRLRRLKKERTMTTISPSDDPSLSS
jgi:type II secretory pathway component PulF